MLKDLIMKNRSCRRFDNNFQIKKEVLESLVELASYTACGANKQGLRYMLINTPADCQKVFPHLRWAGAIIDWDGPIGREQPTAYIIFISCPDDCLSLYEDIGMAAQSMGLGATEQGLAACLIKSFDVKGILQDIAIPPPYQPHLIIALGKKAENIRIKTILPNEPRAYYRDARGVHWVPKIAYQKLIIPLALNNEKD